MEIAHVEMFIMNPCNLHCKDCKDLNPSYPEHVDFEINQLFGMSMISSAT